MSTTEQGQTAEAKATAAADAASPAAASPAVGAKAESDRGTARRQRIPDLLVALVCLAGGVYLTWGLWLDPNHRVVEHNQGDQALFEWLLAYGAHTVVHGSNPLWTSLLNVPLGVNLAVNTSMVLVGAIMAPVTLTLGAPLAYVLVLTINLVLTPYAWYWVFSRHLVDNAGAAALGGLFCGFAPGIASHANGHLNFTAGYLAPFLVLQVVKLATEPQRWRRHGVILGLLVVAQYSIGAETLFFAVLSCTLLIGSYGLLRWREMWRTSVPGLLRGGLLAAAVAATGLAYPLYLQFAGAQRFHGTGFIQTIHNEDLAGLAAYPYQSLARLAGLWTRLAPNYTEETTYYGPVLLVLVVVCVVVLWRLTLVRAMAFTALVMGALALGPRLRVGGHVIGVPLPYANLVSWPLFDSALPARFALALIPIVGALLALAAQRALTLPPKRRRGWYLAIAVALLPLLPLPVPTTARAPVPRFFSSGDWHIYVHSGQTLLPVPPPVDVLPDGQRWQTATEFGFALPAGFFLGPGGPDGRGRIGPPPRPTAQLLTDIALGVPPPRVTDTDRAQAAVDLAYWRVRVIVLSDGGPGSSWTPYRAQLLSVATDLFGRPQRVDDVWLWRVPGR